MTVFRNSLRQLLRMRGRVVLFFLLLVIASGLCSLGRGFMVINREKMEAYEDSFMTIGTVEQKADSVQERLIWDAQIQDYHIYNTSVYNSYTPISVLDFEGTDYLSGPEKRCFYGSYMPEYEMYDIGMHLGVVIEGSPVEDTVPDHPIKFKVTRVLAGRGILEGNVINFCDHYDDTPQKMYADKTYVMTVIDTPGHESEKEFEGDYVTEGFYESLRGKRWLNLIDSWEYALHTFPVTGTNDIHLMMPFYNGSAYMSGGREFTEEEYEQGERFILHLRRAIMKL